MDPLADESSDSGCRMQRFPSLRWYFCRRGRVSLPPFVDSGLSAEGLGRGPVLLRIHRLAADSGFHFRFDCDPVGMVAVAVDQCSYLRRIVGSVPVRGAGQKEDSQKWMIGVGDGWLCAGVLS